MTGAVSEGPSWPGTYVPGSGWVPGPVACPVGRGPGSSRNPSAAVGAWCAPEHPVVQCPAVAVRAGRVAAAAVAGVRGRAGVVAAAVVGAAAGDTVAAGDGDDVCGAFGRGCGA